MDERINRLEERLTRLEGAISSLYALISQGSMPLQGDEPRIMGAAVPAPAVAPGPGPGLEAEQPIALPFDSLGPPPAPQYMPAVPLPSRPYAPPPPNVPSAPVSSTGQLFGVELATLRSSEFWLNKIGIALLLIGLAFLFKYAVDNGWVNEEVRVVFGLLLSTVLLGLGVRLHGDHPTYAHVLLGGSIGAYYLTGFAAYQLFHLVGFWPAFGYMVGVTILAFILALRTDQVMLAVIGAMGGLATPFLLYSNDKNLPGLIAYTCLLLTGISAVYFYRGWRALLWTASIGGWAVFALAVAGLPAEYPRIASGDRWAVQGGLIFGWLAFCLVPVLREALRAKDSLHWPRPTLQWVADKFSQEVLALVNAHVHLLTIITPFIALALSVLVWSEPKQTWGVVLLAGALLYSLIYGGLRRWDARLAYTHLMLAVAFLTGAWLLLLEGNVLFLTLAIQATALLYCARRSADLGMAVASHILFTGLAWAFVGFRLIGGHAEPPAIFNPTALTDLAVLGLAVGASRLTGSWELTWAYRAAVYAALFGWLWRELSPLPNGMSYVLITWAGLATILHYLAPRLEDRVTSSAAHFIFLATGLLLAERLIPDAPLNPAFFNVRALADLTVLALALLASFAVEPRDLRLGYRLAAHGALLAWLWRELVQLPNGNAYITIIWGAYAAALLGVGLWTGHNRILRNFGLGTLFLVVGKLFIVDIAWVDPFWRILLFLGFGGFFLVISYYFQRVFVHPPPTGQTD